MRFASVVCALAAALGVADAAANTKYFHEPGGSDIMGHYDKRHFKKVVDYDTRRDTLSHLTKSWLEFTDKENIETWIAHGTLLGWWWNGKILPWDWDLDVQVKASTLTYLGEKYNQTRYTFTMPLTSSSTGDETREYYLDVNPWIWQRVRGDGMNIIDARWIDVRNGLFIDITGIAETEPDKHPGILHCKNYHRYHYEDIWPTRETWFEGVKAKIPYNFDEILIKEYKPKALVVTEYEGHKWNTVSKEWEVDSKVPAGKKAEELLKNPRVPGKYEMVETGGFWGGLWRLVHWW